MTGGSAMNTPSVIRGWTAFGGPLRTLPTPLVDNMETTTAPTPQDNLNDVQAPTSPAPQTQEDRDQALFRDSTKLGGYVLLDLSERYSTKTMVDQVNLAAGKVIISGPTLNSRLNNALARKAKDDKTTKDQVRAELTERRKARGIRSTRRKPWSQQQGRGAAVTNASDMDAGAANTRDSMEDSSDADMDNINGDAMTPAQQQQADHAAFVDQQSLKGEKMLLMAERYTDFNISARICAIPGNFPLKEGGVANRIHDALKKKAKATGATLEQARADLNTARLSNGVIRQIKLGKVRAPRTARKAKSETTVQNGAADDSSDAAQVPVQIDAEMTDDDGTSSHEGYTAEEVDAANILLKLFSSSPEVGDASPDVHAAATILMDMHGADASLAAQPKQVAHLTVESTNANANDVEMTAATNPEGATNATA